MGSAEKPGNPPSKRKLAAEIGIAGAASIAIGAAGYGMYSRYRSRQQRTFEQATIADFRQSLQIFEEPRLSDDIKTVMAALAVRVYYAPEMTQDPIVNKQALIDMLEHDYGAKSKFEEEHGFALSAGVLDSSIRYLGQFGLIGTAHREDNPQSSGYVAAPALRWAFEGDDEINDFLAQAQYAYLQLHSDGSNGN